MVSGRSTNKNTNRRERYLRRLRIVADARGLSATRFIGSEAGQGECGQRGSARANVSEQAWRSRMRGATSEA
jgi:hypothetical protein